MAKPKNTISSKESNDLIKRLIPENKALAISLAIALALSGFGLSGTIAAIDTQDLNTKKDMVLVQEKEDDSANREWETDEDQSYNYYGSGYGYYYRPFNYTGNSFGRAAWSTPTVGKSVGGYQIFRGHVGS